MTGRKARERGAQRDSAAWSVSLEWGGNALFTLAVALMLLGGALVVFLSEFNAGVVLMMLGLALVGGAKLFFWSASAIRVRAARRFRIDPVTFAEIPRSDKV